MYFVANNLLCEKGESMVNFQDSVTKVNLARAFAGECQEGARYQFLAKMALQEKYSYLSNFIRTLAHNEMSHAEQFINKLNEYGADRVQNIEIHAGYPYQKSDLYTTLLLESKNEKSTGENVYPAFAKIACDEGYKDIAELFLKVAEVEKQHKRVLELLSDALKTKKLYKSNDAAWFKCDECGFVVKGKTAPKICPLCQAEQGYFRIDFSNFEELGKQ